MSVPFSSGRLNGRPTAAKAVILLLNDLDVQETRGGFRKWLAGFVFPPAPHEAKHLYCLAKQRRDRIRRFFGDDYELFEELAQEHFESKNT